MSDAALVVAARHRLGECPLWCERSGALYWTDIEGSTIGRLQADGVVRTWRLPDRVGSFAFCDSPTQVLLGFASGIALFELETETISPVIPVEPDQPTTRINDGRCDRQGRFVFGMFNPAEAPIGHVYRVHADLRVERLPLPPLAVANSIAFSPDGATMYFADSPTRTIWRLDYGADGSIGTPSVFVRLSPQEGFPDGSCVDAEGGLWNAQWDGGCLVRYDADGTVSERLPLPVPRPTCPAFGGPDLSTLYVTAARAGVYAVPSRWRGLPESRFRLAA